MLVFLWQQSRSYLRRISWQQCFSTWGHEPFLEGLGVDILCTQLYYIFFIRVSDGGRGVIVDGGRGVIVDGGRGVIVGFYNGSQYEKG